MNNEKMATLIHYASPYYDPVKAHEYYMRTRELKGRRSSSALSDEGKEIWSYTKNEIKNEKSEKVKEEQARRKERIAELQQKAKITRTRITSNLKNLNSQLSIMASIKKKDINNNKKSDVETMREEADKKRSHIEERKTSEIKKLMDEKIPTGLSKEERAKKIAERSQKIAKLRSDAKADKAGINEQLKSDKKDRQSEAQSQRAEVSNDTKAQKKENSNSAKSARARVSADLKSAVQAARDAYKSAKTDLDSSYEEIYQKEYDRIIAEHRKITKHKSSKK